MTQRHEVESRLALYEDLAGIFGAMRSFALAELHRVLRREEAQQAVLAAMQAALGDLAAALPAVASGADVWVLIGSVHGFCGSFNEDVIAAWRAAGAAAAPTVAVGERLADLLPTAPAIRAIPGAVGGLDAAATIDRLLAAVDALRCGGGAGLVVCLRDEDGARCQRLLPLERSAGTEALPLTLRPAPQVAVQVAEHALFHHLLALLLRAVRVENRMRLLQMENALRHLDEGRDDLRRQRNRLRQEEIIEEIALTARRRADVVRALGS